MSLSNCCCLTYIQVSQEAAKVVCTPISSGTVRFMNRGKSDTVKQEMARLNTDILGVSELKWMGVGNVNSVKT